MGPCEEDPRDSEEAGEDPKRFDFGFAFNNPDFADRIIRLRVSTEDDVKLGLSESSEGVDESTDVVSQDSGLVLRPDIPDQVDESPSRKIPSTKNSKTSLTKKKISAAREMDDTSSSAIDTEDTVSAARDMDETFPAARESEDTFPAARESEDTFSAARETDDTPTISLHLSSVILAAKSSYFRALFTCGFKEACKNKPVILTVTPEEEAPVVDLLHFIYTGDMQESVKDPEAVIKMFVVADKFGVTSCMKICLEKLASLSMTVQTACLYLSLPDSMHTHKGIANLLETSRVFLINYFRDLEKNFKSEEFLELPIVGLQTLLASDELNVREELTVFLAMIEWVRHHYSDVDARRKTAALLSEFVRFPLMTGDDLEEIVLKSPEMETPDCSGLVREATWFRSYSLVRRLRLMNETAQTHRRFWQRKWNRNSVGYVYFDIHLERFQSLSVAQTVESATFGIGGKRFYLSARHGRRDDGTETLDIHLHLDNAQNVQPEIQVSFIFYAKRWPEGQFDFLRDRVTKGFGRNASNWGYSNILGRPWADVVQNDSKYFNNGVMSVFAEVQLLEQDVAKA